MRQECSFTRAYRNDPENVPSSKFLSLTTTELLWFMTSRKDSEQTKRIEELEDQNQELRHELEELVRPS